MSIQPIILAAGLGKRMQSTLPKVLHHLAGKPLLEHVVQVVKTISERTPIIIYGYQGERLQKELKEYDLKWIHQSEQLGTGHAVYQAIPHVNSEDQVLVLYGDVPLISVITLQDFIEATPKNAIGMLTTTLSNPKGYGRIKRDPNNQILGIVEEKDASAKERQINEINSGIYLIPAQLLQRNLPLLKNNNAQKEYYLTDIIALALEEKIDIVTTEPKHKEELFGINDKVQLAQLERFYQYQQAETLMQKGVTLMDPARFDLRGTANVGQDTYIDVNVIFEGDVVIGNHCKIGANSILRNVVLGDYVDIKANSIIESSVIASHCIIGPFARIRPETMLDEHVHIGNFVEIKKSHIGEKTKINHLSYIGDSELGVAVNIGAGTITCNYDGVSKHKTIIGDRVQVGSDSTLVAPLTIHSDAYVAAATTVRHTVPAGALVYNSREEKLCEEWTAKRLSKLKKD